VENVAGVESHAGDFGLKTSFSFLPAPADAGKIYGVADGANTGSRTRQQILAVDLDG
jgi:hypothetical protein